ncbi:hypothetical protein [Rhizobium sp. AAP43]|uniref:hypothetical protein n=1 Tax=Rhizobium sp. AAP43 TaxID=1523420 RepID=UPI0006B8914C|nr:hypothetical protein [Rhizobium sp. AAP43]KPF42093.1 hypothetical protein IP76_18510 [Rhizobium sp. AAP43]
MVDLALLTGLAGGLKTAVDIGKTIKEINDLTVIRSKVIEMQDIILGAQSSAMAAQTQLFELLQENSELKAKVAAVDDWKATAARYQLRDFGEGTYAYELKEDAANGEPPHKLCPVCFENGKRSLLQFQGKTASKQDINKCLSCGGDFYLGTRAEINWPSRPNRRV